MPELTPSHSAPITPTTPSRREIGRTQTSTSNPPRLSRVFSTQHLDDVSVYNGVDHDSQYHAEEDDSGDSDTLEKLRQEDDDEALGHGQDQVPEVQMGVRDTRDLEANKLEKKRSTRSIKDPNLVGADGVLHTHEQGG